MDTKKITANESGNDAKREKVRVIPIEFFDDFPKHPFNVKMDTEMEALIESIKEFGMLQEDYLDLIKRLGSREATTRRFFIAFEYESEGARRGNEEAQAISFLHTAARTAQNFLKQCGNDVLIPDNIRCFLLFLPYLSFSFTT